MNRRGELVIVVVVALVLIFLGWLATQAWKECRSDAECSAGQYCGSDFACHDMPQVIVQQSPPSTTQTAWVIAFAIIIAMLIYKWDKIFPREKKPRPKHMDYAADKDGLMDDALNEEY